MNSVKEKISELLNRLKNYNKIAGISKLSRRYFAVNGFDGVITSIGILLGNYIIGVTDYKNVLITGMAVIISLGVSGIWSSYNSESAERKKEMNDLQEATLYNLDKTVIASAQKFATVVLAAVNGFSPVITAFIPLIPFLLGKYISIKISYYSGFALAFLILFGIGLFLGKISKTNLIVNGIKMLLAGGISVGLSLLLKFIA